MVNPFVLIVEAADFLMRALLDVYVSFFLLIVGAGFLARLAARPLAKSLPDAWRRTFVNSATVFGIVLALLTAPRLLSHAPHWLR